MAPGVPGCLPAGARHRRADVVGCVGVQALLDRSGRHTQRLPARGHLDGLHVPAIDRSGTYEGFDFGDDLSLERIGERRFFSCPVASTGLASQMASLMSSNLPQVARKSRYVATSRSTFVSNGPGRSCKVLVLPSTLVVKA
jgi:hypothetical protein